MSQPAVLPHWVPSWATLILADNPSPMTLDGTNTWILRAPGESGCVVVDPGPLLDEHLEAVAALGPVALTLLTHGHFDHSESATRFATMTGSAVLAQDPAHCVGGDVLITDGEPLKVAGLSIRTFATPGHSSDSVSFVIEQDGDHQAVLTGDTVLGRGTTVVAWPDGQLGDYLRSLHTLEALGAVPVLPGHGPVLPDLEAVAQSYLKHREMRLTQVAAAVRAGASDAAEVVEVVYADVDRSLWPAAEMSVRAQLDHLRATDPSIPR
jgi:glyoxylase-like metal-dependent hydrolase (beta-lactamase superfamily II)